MFADSFFRLSPERGLSKNFVLSVLGKSLTVVLEFEIWYVVIQLAVISSAVLIKPF